MNLNYTYEFLIIINRETSGDLYFLCKDETTLLGRISQETGISISSEDGFSFENKNLKYESKLQKESKIEKNFQFSISATEEDILPLSNLIKKIKTLFLISKNQNPGSTKINAKFVTLKDDISFYFANKSYPYIHKIEAEMRKFITIILSGSKNTAYPGDFKCKRESNNNFFSMDECDFIELTEKILLTKSPQKDIDGLLNKISRAVSTSDLNLTLEELKEYIPTSLWRREFFEITQKDETYIKKLWSDLYELRIKVAHTKQVNSSDHEKIIKLTTEASDLINQAIERFDQFTDDAKDNLQEVLESELSQETEYKEELEEVVSFSIQRGVIFDTNKTYNEESVWEMVEQDIVAAYGNVKHVVNYLNKNDIIFLYHADPEIGIIAACQIKSPVKAKNEWTLYREAEFLTCKPQKEIGLKKSIKAREIKRLLGRNFYWARTVKTPYLNQEETEKLLAHAIEMLGKPNKE